MQTIFSESLKNEPDTSEFVNTVAEFIAGTAYKHKVFGYTPRFAEIFNKLRTELSDNCNIFHINIRISSVQRIKIGNKLRIWLDLLINTVYPIQNSTNITL